MHADYMEFNVHYWLQHYGYGGILAMLAIEMFGIPLPVETTLTVSGIAWSKGTFSLIPLLVAAFIGHNLGGTATYWIGFYWGRPVIERFGKYVGINADRLNIVQEKFIKYRIPLILFSKFLLGVRVLVPYLAGINGMSYIRFVALNALGSIIWIFVFVFSGLYIEKLWKKYSEIIMHPFVIAILLVVASIAVYFHLKRKSKKRGVM